MQEREFHPPHFYEDHSPYFLTARNVGGRSLLETPTKRDLLRDVLRAAVPDYGIKLHAWVILADHYHLLLETSDVAPIHKFVRRLHGQSAIGLNKMDAAPGRQVWYQYWDRCPRNERDFWAYFNYIHVNPIKHGCVRLPGGGAAMQAGLTGMAAVPEDFNASLAQYTHSSYPYYLRTYGAEALTELWMRYPIPDYLEADEL